LSFLLDTNVISELRRRRPDPGVQKWLAGIDASELSLSVLVVGELRQGIERLRQRDARRAAQLEQWLERLTEQFAERILPVTATIADEWGRLNARDRVPAVDGLIAATAAVHGLTVVTRNVQDFRRTGVRCLDPFARSDEPGT
jgi:toxin FitB